MFGLGIGATEVLVILVIGLFLFGHKLPGIARYLGKTVSEFRHEARALTDDLAGDGRRAV
jgi:TatA/E family protein of Tat protein translocase